MVHRLVVPALLLVACNSSPPALSDAGVDGHTDGRIGQCAAGLKPYGPACVPIFDECKDDEVPLLGGGCKKVGVEECTPAGGGVGIKGPPDWSCKPIGPPTTCLPGWAITSDGWCEPILPAAPCGPGTMEVIGKSECQPIGDCGSGTWGKIATSAATIFVDRSHAGPSDGSMAKPYATIGQALAAVGPGAQLAIAAGDYPEDVTVAIPTVLEGRCPQLVRIVGQIPTGSAVAVEGGTTTLRGLTVTGPGGGIRVEASAVLERVAVTESGGAGIRVAAGGSLALADSLVAGAGRFGLWLAGSTAKLQRVVVRDTKPDPVNAGSGIIVSAKDGPARLELTDSIVAANAAYGISIWGGEAAIARSVVRDSRPHADQTLGRGILCAAYGAKQGQLVLGDSLVASNRMDGIRVDDSIATLERVVVRDTDSQASDGEGGLGLNASTSSLTLRDSAVARNRGWGVVSVSSSLVLERTAVRDTRPQISDGAGGDGIGSGRTDPSAPPSSATLRESLIAGNRDCAVSVWSSSATIERSIVRDTHADPASGHWGAGIVGYDGAKLAIRDCLVAGNRFDGVEVSRGGSEATLERTIVRDTGFDAMENGDLSYGINAQLDSTLSLSECVIARTRWLGVLYSGAKGTISRSVVRDTAPHLAAGVLGIGVGVMAFYDEAHPTPQPSTVTVHGSVVARNRGVGIGVQDSSVTVEASVVRGTLQGKDLDGTEGYGDGIYVRGARGSVAVASSLLESNLRAGLLFYGAGGSAQRSVFSKGVFAIDVEEAAAPLLGDDNVYEGNVENRVTWGNKLAPLAPLTIPSMP